MAQPPHIKREMIHGFWLNFDESLRMTGVYYLQSDMQYQEAKTLFDAARMTGQAHFEDDQDRDYSLVYNRGDNSYTLMSRQRE